MNKKESTKNALIFGFKTGIAYEIGYLIYLLIVKYC